MDPGTSQLLESLAIRLRKGICTQQEIQAATGVHQSQVSRILAGQAKRLSKNVELLCKYAEGLAKADRSSTSKISEELCNKVLELWDGSAAHAQALDGVLDALGKLQHTVRRRR